MKYWIAANWKLNKTPQEARDFVSELSQAKTKEDVVYAVFPQNFSCEAVAEGLKSTDVLWGSQNCYFEESGAFTGENSVSVLREMGAKTVLIGHSERRELFGESGSLLSKKVRAAQGAGLTPVFCVGETLDQRKSGQSVNVVLAQLREGLSEAEKDKDIVVAYEPVWAIGTGEVATPEQAQEIHQAIREELKKLSLHWGQTTPILYGGSVKPENAAELAKQEEIGGFLVGGASLKVPSFIQIYDAFEAQKNP